MELKRQILSLVFWAITQHAYANDILTSPIVTNWGFYGAFQHCPHGTKVIGFQLKTERWDGWDIFVDDTCLNGIRFYCGRPSSSGPGEPVDIISSSEGNWGSWGHIFWCDGLGFAQGFMLRSEEATTPAVDETAANNMRIVCSGGDKWIEGDGEQWVTDDTSLNNIRVECCDMTKEELLSYGLVNSTNLQQE